MSLSQVILKMTEINTLPIRITVLHHSSTSNSLSFIIIILLAKKREENGTLDSQAAPFRYGLGSPPATKRQAT